MSTLLFGLDSINDHKLQPFPFVFQWPDSALKSEVGDRIQSVTILAAKSPPSLATNSIFFTNSKLLVTNS